MKRPLRAVQLLPTYASRRRIFSLIGLPDTGSVHPVRGLSGGTMSTEPPNRLYFGDCLEVMRDDIPSESVDLIYLDPPFNSKRLYNAFIGGALGCL